MNAAAATDQLAFWSRAAESSPVIVLILLGAIMLTLGAIRHLMNLLDKRQEMHAAALEKRDEKYDEMHDKTLSVIADHTNAMRDLRETIRSTSGRA